jgi:alkylation response protein AidB-like acyl-CoA dehydrogenase
MSGLGALLPLETPAETHFRERVRAWLADSRQLVVESVPADENPGVLIERARQFQAELFAAGFAGISWPQEFGGQGLTAREEIIFVQESAPYDLPNGPLAVTLGMCAPTLLAHGSSEQKRRHIRAILSGEEIWCQLFSEPGAGSDLAGLQTRAEAVPEGWLVNGQKSWTTWAQFADFAILLARTDPQRPKHKGLTMFLLNMRHPGIVVRELRQMSGRRNFNEVFIDGVPVPPGAVIGVVNGGWETATTTLANERTFISASWPSATLTQRLVELATRRLPSLDVELGQRIADIWCREAVLRVLSIELLETIALDQSPGPAGSLGKLGRAELGELVADLETDILGLDSIAWQPGDSESASVVADILHAPGFSIAGGTKEIMRNVIAERILGLPREPRTEGGGAPFSTASRRVLLNDGTS